MFFNSIEFLVFMAAVLALYYVLPHRGQNLLLLAGSYLFYGSWDWRFLSLILFSTVVDYCCGLGMHRAEARTHRRILVTVSLVVNLGLLAFFKYFNFFAGSLAELAASVGIHLDVATLRIVLPVGISFYTFQTLSYTIDIYRRELEPTRDFADFALFVAFFPQLVAGPIERAARLLPQITRPRSPNWHCVSEGSVLLLIGFFQKVVLADNLALLADRVFSGPVPGNGLVSLLGLYAFAFQILCDFAGYSNIARGLAKLMGFDLMINFNVPYAAANPSEFWRRWHISLSTWLRDYLYIPLGGSRVGPRRTYVNLALTMLLGGLWHGAAWTFVAWGAYQGLLLAVHRALASFRWPVLPGLPAAVRKQLTIVLFFQLVCIGWLLFRAETIVGAWQLLVSMLDFGSYRLDGGVTDFLLRMWPWWGLLIVVEAQHYVSGRVLGMMKWPLPLRVLMYLVMFYAIVIFGVNDAQSFIYFQF